MGYDMWDYLFFNNVKRGLRFLKASQEEDKIRRPFLISEVAYSFVTTALYNNDRSLNVDSETYLIVRFLKKGTVMRSSEIN